MSKRFVDTQKYRKRFIRSLPAAYKLLWDYICLECDHAGIWQVDFDMVRLCLGADAPVSELSALELFNADKEEEGERIIVLNKGRKWFIPSFIDFQYGELNPENRAHKSVIMLLQKEGVFKGLTPDKKAPSEEPPKEAPVKKAKSKKEPKTPPIPLPADFGISDAVRSWAEKDGYTRLDEHLAWFKDWATAGRNGEKLYVDWDSTFRNAIRGNWAQLKEKGGSYGRDQKSPGRHDTTPSEFDGLGKSVGTE